MISCHFGNSLKISVFGHKSAKKEQNYYGKSFKIIKVQKRRGDFSRFFKMQKRNGKWCRILKSEKDMGILTVF